MSIVIEHLNYIYSENTAYQRQALKDINPKSRRNAVYRPHRPYRFRKIHADPAPERAFEGVQRRDPFNGENIYEKDYDMRKLRAKRGLVFQYPEHQLFEV